MSTAEKQIIVAGDGIPTAAAGGNAGDRERWSGDDQHGLMLVHCLAHQNMILHTSSLCSCHIPTCQLLGAVGTPLKSVN
jgi:hypothetical protein